MKNFLFIMSLKKMLSIPIFHKNKNKFSKYHINMTVCLLNTKNIKNINSFKYQYNNTRYKYEKNYN